MPTNNVLLNLMNSSDRDALLGVSELVELKYRDKLEDPCHRIEFLYFIESGFASLIYKGRGDHVAEIAIVGPEGCTGCSTLLGVDRSPQATMVQVAGSAQRIRTADAVSVMRSSRRLHEYLLLFVHTQLIQRDETALAASKGTIIERLARWLLMVGDRIAASDLPLTHELISIMLASRRAGVTTALGNLHGKGLIDLDRGNIHITDREGLVRVAGVYYGAPEAEYHRVFSSGSFESLFASA